MSLLGDIMKAKREHVSIGVREAAKLAGVSHVTISRIERGEDPDIPNFAKVCTWLGLSSSMFLSKSGLK